MRLYCRFVHATVQPVAEVTDEIVAAFGRLMPQLSSTARVNAELLRQLIAHDATVLLVARLNGEIVGATTLVTYPVPTGWRAHIDDVVVDAPARGQRIGEALVSAALTEARARGVRTVDLTSRPSRTSAIRLYQRMGFTLRESRVYRCAMRQ